jgi:hypothetical protein
MIAIIDGLYRYVFNPRSDATRLALNAGIGQSPRIYVAATHLINVGRAIFSAKHAIMCDVPCSSSPSLPSQSKRLEIKKAFLAWMTLFNVPDKLKR